MVEVRSRYFKDVETRYAIMELEVLAINYANKQCHLYLPGLSQFEVLTNHQPVKTYFKRKLLFAIDNDNLKNKNELKSKYVFTV